MKKTIGFNAVAATVLIGGSAAFVMPAAQSHHSFAMYDQSETVTFTGALTRFVPGANHAQLIFELRDAEGKPVLGDDGKPMVWGVETGPAAQIAREGVTVKAFPSGTILTVSLHPLRDGRPFGALADAGLVKCGMQMPEGGCTDETGDVFLASDGS